VPSTTSNVPERAGLPAGTKEDVMSDTASPMSQPAAAAPRWRRLLPWATVAAVALAAHAAFVIESHRDIVFRFPLIDAATYHRLAVQLAAGGSFPADPFWQPPLYPLLLAALYRLGIASLLAVRLVHGLLTAGTALMTYAIARRLAGPRAALAAGLLVGLNGPLLFFFSQLLPAGLAATLLTAALLAALRALERPTAGRVALCGGLLGVAAINVPNALLVAPLVAAALVWRRPGAGAQASPRSLGPGVAAGLLAATVILPIVPVTARNVIVSGQFVPISTNGGINLYIGNNARWRETVAIRPGLDWNRLVAQPFRYGGCRSESEAERYFVRRAVSYAVHHPLAFAGGLAAKAGYLGHSLEVPRNLDLYTMRRHSRVLAALVWRAGSFGFPFAVLGPLAAVGLLLTARQGRAHALVAGAALLYAGSVVLFFPASRYAAPVLPLLTVLAVAGVAETVRLWRDRRPARFAVLLAVPLAAAACVPVQLPTDGVNFESELETDVGIALQVRGLTALAIDHYARAAKLDPANVEAWFHMGTAYREQKVPDKALLCYRVALRTRPDHNRAMNDLAVVLFEKGEKEESVAWLRRSLQLEPGDRKTMRNLAVGLLTLGHLTEANTWLERAGEEPVTAAQLKQTLGIAPVD
jgi:4-amino-4-deoxy-L-arabinose transferase-like glycosyltransferase